MRSNHTQQKPFGRTFVAVEMQSKSDIIVVSEPIYALPNSYRAHKISQKTTKPYSYRAHKNSQKTTTTNSYRAHKNSQKTTTTYSYRAHKNSQKTTTTYCPFSMTSSLHSTDGRKEVTTVNKNLFREFYRWLVLYIIYQNPTAVDQIRATKHIT